MIDYQIYYSLGFERKNPTRKLSSRPRLNMIIYVTNVTMVNHWKSINHDILTHARPQASGCKLINNQF